MFKLFITIFAIAKMTEAIPLAGYQIYDPSLESENMDEQDLIGTEMFKIIDDSQGSSIDLMTPQMLTQLMEKRVVHHTDPCGCPFKIRYESYGENAYPRHYRSKICDTEKISMKKYCMYGGKCREFFYEVRFLVPKKSENLLEHHLPSELNKLYGWVSKNISIDCRCLN